MASATNRCDGMPIGTVVAATSGDMAGDAFEVVAPLSDCTIQADTTHAAEGTTSIKFATGSTEGQAAGSIQWTTILGTSDDMYARCAVYITALPSAPARIIHMLSAAGTSCAALNITASGKIQTYNAASAQIQLGTVTVPLNEWFGVSLHAHGNASTGSTSASYYRNWLDPVPLETLTSAATQNTTGTIGQVRFGCQFQVYSWELWLDAFKASTTGLPIPQPWVALPKNIDATYDDSADPAVHYHQEHHDAVHDVINAVDRTTIPSTPVMLAGILGNYQSGTTYTLQASDAGMIIECDNSGTVTVTIPANVDCPVPVGTVIQMYQLGAGSVVAAGAAGVALEAPNSLHTTACQYATLNLRKRAANIWVVSGDIA